MHRGYWKSCISHVKGKDAFRTLSFATQIQNASYRFASSKGRQFTASAQQDRGRHPNNTCMHTPCQLYQNMTYPRNSRQISWLFKSQPRPTEFNDLPDNEDDVARVAILNKFIKGRQTDLMLRCKWNPLSPIFCLLRAIGTILDAQGTKLNKRADHP